MDYLSNAGPGIPKRLMPKEIDAIGLVPMIVHFDGNSFGAREPALENSSKPPYHLDSWIIDRDAAEAVFLLSNKEELRMMKVTLP